MANDEALTERETKILLTKAEKNPYYVLCNRACHHAAFCVRFFALCNEVMFDTPDRALEQAFIARILAKKTRDPHLMAKASSMVGAGYRIESVYTKAEKCIDEAKRIAKGCACCLAEICMRHGLILANQFRFDEAHAAFSDSIGYHEQLEDSNGVARVLIHRGSLRMTTTCRVPALL